ncbi:hypothetical protein P9112_006085 [Eukaryota sp. TZLM1-RC]
MTTSSTPCTTSPLKIDYFDFHTISTKLPREWRLGLTELPGCQRSGYTRCLNTDLATIQTHSFSHVIILLQKRELSKYNVHNLLSSYESINITPFLFEIEDGHPPSTHQLKEITSLIFTFNPNPNLNLNRNSNIKPLLHCQGGLGRTGVVVAALVLVLGEGRFSVDESIAKVREVRGPRAVQTVKQFKFLVELNKNQEFSRFLWNLIHDLL